MAIFGPREIMRSEQIKRSDERNDTKGASESNEVMRSADPRPPVCDYCYTNLATGKQWIGGGEAALCSQCALHLATHPYDRQVFMDDLADERR